MSDIYAENMRRNESESHRLNEQFDLVSRYGKTVSCTYTFLKVFAQSLTQFPSNIGYLVHPSIAAKLPPSPTIADIGTGTGLFPSQLAQEYPDAILHGFDISPNLFPPKETLSPQVSLSVLNIKETPPSSTHNKYDLIHIRLLAAGINPTEWKPIVGNLLKLLKPGGAIQWEECNWMETQYYCSEINSSVQAARYMCARFKEGMKDKFSYGWKILPRIYEEFGMVDMLEDIVSSDRIVETRAAMARNAMDAIFGWARLVSKRNLDVLLSAEELVRLEKEVQRDIASGCYVRYDVHVVLGFKCCED